MFIFFNILIAGGLISYNSGIIQGNKSTNTIDSISESNTYKWGVTITHFLAYLFMINYSFTKAIPDERIKKLMNDYLPSFSEKAVFAFNLSSFNYIFPGSFILEIIAGVIYQHCKDTSIGFFQCIPTVIKNCFNFFGPFLKCIIIVLILSYILNLSTVECNPPTDTTDTKVDDSYTYCWWIKMIILVINFIISCLLGCYLFFHKSTDPCKEFFGLALKGSKPNNSNKSLRHII